MAAHPDADHTPVPLGSIVFGYGPMIPLAAAAIGAWTLGPSWPSLAETLAIIWGAIILVFVAGVRRGYGFGAPEASTTSEIAIMLIYFTAGGLALVLSTFRRPTPALALLILGFGLVALFDRRAAFTGDAPTHFARLRGPQMALAAAALALLLMHQLRQSDAFLIQALGHGH